MSTANRKWLILIIVLVALMVLAIVGGVFGNQSAQNQTPPTPTASSTDSTQTSSTAGLKTYINTEFGFEFQYPESWTFYANTFGSPFSKFNLVGVPIEASSSIYFPSSPFLINIVTPDFADRADISFKNLKASASVIAIGGISGTKYSYEFESIPSITVDLPFGEYRILFGAEKRYEDVFNQILASFKFLK